MCLSQETTDYSHLERLKSRHVPVVLFDRIADADYPSVSTNDVEIARQTFLLLHDLLNGSESVKSIVINSQLNIRDSTRNNF